MFEEPESKWVKVAEIGNNRSFKNRGNYRGNSECSRSRLNLREETRDGGMVERTRSTEQSSDPPV